MHLILWKVLSDSTGNLLSTSFNGTCISAFLFRPLSSLGWFCLVFCFCWFGLFFAFVFPTKTLYEEMLLWLDRRDLSRYTNGEPWEYSGIMCLCYTTVTLSYCPSTVFIIAVTEATLLKYWLLLNVILSDKLRTRISAFLWEMMLNCCKCIQTQRDKTNKLMWFCFPSWVFLLICFLVTLLSGLIT